MKDNTKINVTPESLLSLTGIASMTAGVLYIFIQLIHPLDELASVSTDRWSVVAVLTSVMSFLNIIGFIGIYSSNIKKLRILGLIGFIALILFWLISMIFSFNEAFILPLLVKSSPEFVIGMTGLFTNVISTADVGIFPILSIISGLLYIFGGMIFGFAFIRSGVLPKYVTILFTVASGITILASIVPHPFDRALAIPMGISLVLLGWQVFYRYKYAVIEDIFEVQSRRY